MGILLLDFHFSMRSWPGLRECGNRDSDFQGLVGGGGNLVLVFRRRPQPGISAALFRSCAFPLLEAGEQFPLGRSHLRRGAGVAVGPRPPFHLIDGEIVFQPSAQPWQLP